MLPGALPLSGAVAQRARFCLWRQHLHCSVWTGRINIKCTTSVSVSLWLTYGSDLGVTWHGCNMNILPHVTDALWCQWPGCNMNILPHVTDAVWSAALMSMTWVEHEHLHVRSWGDHINDVLSIQCVHNIHCVIDICIIYVHMLLQGFPYCIV